MKRPKHNKRPIIVPFGYTDVFFILLQRTRYKLLFIRKNLTFKKNRAAGCFLLLLFLALGTLLGRGAGGGSCELHCGVVFTITCAGCVDGRAPKAPLGPELFQEKLDNNLGMWGVWGVKVEKAY